MTNWVKVYNRTGTSHAVAVHSWGTGCRDYELDYLRFCKANNVKPLAEKQFAHILKVCDKQYATNVW